MKLRVGIVGCGLIGSRRARCAAEAGDSVVAVADVAIDRAPPSPETTARVPRPTGARSSRTPEIDAVVVATFNAALADVASAALDAGKHVLCEKPFGCNATEALRLVEAARPGRPRRQGRVHATPSRGSRSGARAGRQRRDRRSRRIAGRLRARRQTRVRPGVARRPGLWRAVASCSTRACTSSTWAAGSSADFARVSGAVGTWVWRVEPLEDNGFALLQTADGRVATLHTSWTQWRNLFRLEVLGTEGLVTVDGLGGSYGPETLVHARRRPEGGAPDERQWVFETGELAWSAEWEEFGGAVLRRTGTSR